MLGPTSVYKQIIRKLIIKSKCGMPINSQSRRAIKAATDNGNIHESSTTPIICQIQILQLQYNIRFFLPMTRGKKKNCTAKKR